MRTARVKQYDVFRATTMLLNRGKFLIGTSEIALMMQMQQGWGCRGDYAFQDAFFSSHLHTVASESNSCLDSIWSL